MKGDYQIIEELRSEVARLREQLVRSHAVLVKVTEIPFFKNPRIEELVREAGEIIQNVPIKRLTGDEIRAYQEEHQVGFYDAKAALTALNVRTE